MATTILPFKMEMNATAGMSLASMEQLLKKTVTRSAEVKPPSRVAAHFEIVCTGLAFHCKAFCVNLNPTGLSACMG